MLRLSLRLSPNSPGPGFSMPQLCLETPWWSLAGVQTLMSSAVMSCSTRSTATPGFCLTSPVSPCPQKADIHLQPCLCLGTLTLIKSHSGLLGPISKIPFLSI